MKDFTSDETLLSTSSGTSRLCKECLPSTSRSSSRVVGASIGASALLLSAMACGPKELPQCFTDLDLGERVKLTIMEESHYSDCGEFIGLQKGTSLVATMRARAIKGTSDFDSCKSIIVDLDAPRYALSLQQKYLEGGFTGGWLGGRYDAVFDDRCSSVVDFELYIRPPARPVQLPLRATQVNEAPSVYAIFWNYGSDVSGCRSEACYAAFAVDVEKLPP